jgi:hypothetical protein
VISENESARKPLPSILWAKIKIFLSALIRPMKSDTVQMSSRSGDYLHTFTEIFASLCYCVLLLLIRIFNMFLIKGQEFRVFAWPKESHRLILHYFQRDVIKV